MKSFFYRSCIRIIFILIGCFSFFERADADLGMCQLVDTTAEFSTRGKFEESIQGVQDLVQVHRDKEAGRSAVIYGTKTFKKVIAGLVDSVTLGTSGWVVDISGDLVIDGLDSVSEQVVQKSMNMAINASLYALHSQNNQKLADLFRISDSVQRSKMLLQELKSLDSFTAIQPKDTQERAIFNSRAIISLIAVTKGLSLQAVDFSKEVEKLKQDFEKFKQEKVKNNFKNIQTREKKYRQDKGKLLETGIKVAEKTVNRVEQEELKGRGQPKNGLNEPQENDQKSDFNPDLESDDFQESLDEFAQISVKVAEGARGLFEIGINLGMSEKDQRRLGKAVFVIQNAASFSVGVARAYGGDITGAIQAGVALTALFGNNRNRPSAEALRHEQLMQQFGFVFENQKIMLENQKKIIELQVMTYRLVSDLYRMNYSSFVHISKKLETILGNQAALMESVVQFSDLHLRLNRCDRFLNARLSCNPSHLGEGGNLPACFESIVSGSAMDQGGEGFRRFFQPRPLQNSSVIIMGGFSDYSAVQDHLSAEGYQDFLDCTEAVADIFSVDTHMLFETRSHVTVDGRATQYENLFEPIYEPLMDLFSGFFSTQIEKNSYYYSLLSPQRNYDVSSTKTWNVRDHLEENQSSLLTEEQIQKGLEELLYVPALERYVAYLIELTPYEFVIERHPSGRNLSILSAEQVASKIGEPASRGVVNRLHSAVRMVNLAIAQQNLLAGDGLLHLLGPSLFHPNLIEKRNLALNALKHNSILTENFLVYELREDLMYLRTEEMSNVSEEEVLGQHLRSYQKYYQEGYKHCKRDAKGEYGDDCDSELVHLLGDKWVFDGRTLVFPQVSGDVRLPLPAPTRMAIGEMRHTPSIYRLLYLREALMKTVYRNLGAYETVIEENLYVF